MCTRPRSSRSRWRLSSAGWLLVTIVAMWSALGLIAMLILGCASSPVTTTVRRAHSLADVDAIGDELGREGWHVVVVEAVDGGWSYVVVAERKAGAR